MNIRKNLAIAGIITLLSIGFGGLVVANQQLIAETGNPNTGLQTQTLSNFSASDYEEYDDDDYEEHDDDDYEEHDDDDDKYEDDDDDDYEEHDDDDDKYEDDDDD